MLQSVYPLCSGFGPGESPPIMPSAPNIGCAVRTGRFLLILLVLSAPAIPCQAQNVVGLSGDIEVASFPASLLSGQFVSQTSIRLLLEGPGIVTAGMPGFPYDGAIHNPALPVIPGDNTFGNAITTPYGGPGLPAVGTELYSILLHFDPNLSGLPFSLTDGIGRSGSISFDQPILGVYVDSGAMNSTDAIFKPGGVTYTTNAARDMEFNYDGDSYSISPNRYTLTLTMFGHNGGFFDEARIILAMGPVVGVSLDHEAGALALLAPAPNPANSVVRLGFTLPTGGHARIQILDVAGRVVRTVADGDYPAGRTEVAWNGLTRGGSRAASGIYFVQLQSGKIRETRRIVFTR